MRRSLRAVQLVRRYENELRTTDNEIGQQAYNIRRGYYGGGDRPYVDMDTNAQAWLLAEECVKRRKLGRKLALWSQLISMAAGLPDGETVSDEEAQALLVAWAVASKEAAS